MILDTSFLVDVLRGDASVAELVRTVDERGPARITTVSVMELWEGIHLADSATDERAAVKRLLDELHEVQFDRECAMTAGEISASLRDSGEPIDTADVQIGAVARVHGAPVVTANAERFDRIDGVETISY